MANDPAQLGGSAVRSGRLWAAGRSAGRTPSCGPSILHPDLSGLGPRSLPLYAPAVALSAPVLDHRLGWTCETLPAASERLRHMLFHRWDLARPLTVGIASPSQSINAALAAEGLNVDLTETAVLAVPLYAITSKDRANVQEVCRSTYAVAA